MAGREGAPANESDAVARVDRFRRQGFAAYRDTCVRFQTRRSDCDGCADLCDRCSVFDGARHSRVRLVCKSMRRAGAGVGAEMTDVNAMKTMTMAT